MANHDSSKEMKKILIVGTTGIGNFLLFLPALFKLRKAFPETQIDLLTFNHNEIDLNFSNRFGIHHIINFYHPKYESKKNGMSILKLAQNQIGVIKKLRREKYDLSIMPFSGKTTPPWEAVNYLAGAKKRLLFRTQTLSRFLNPQGILPESGLRDFQQNLILINRICLKSNCISDEFSEIPIRDDEKKWAYEYLENLGIKNEFCFGFQPVGKLAFNSSRQWTSEKYVELCNQLAQKYQVHCLLFGRQNEKVHLSVISQGIPNSQVILDLPLHRVAALISSLQLFVANDSALMHLAAMVGVPTIGIFGPTDPGRTAPYGKLTKVVRLGLQCSPCFDKGYSEKCPHKNCLTQLEVSRVMESIKELMNCKAKGN